MAEQESRGHKRKWEGKRMQHGSQGGKRRDMGRKEWQRQRHDKRTVIEERQSKRQKEQEEGKESVLPKPFSTEEISQEERRPKHKVAVLIGYSGTGYHGMQIATSEKTIEGDLFSAFVAANAISKANANDPKKSQLVRCARTDKGVHAAGNVISLKLIIEDKDIVEKINSHLSPQIRVWGIQRTVNSFSAYQACDSRWYEYLIPTQSFLPPHPSCWLSKKLVEIADEADDRAGYDARQEEVAEFWDKVERNVIQPILDDLSEEVRKDVRKALYDVDHVAGDDPRFTSGETMRDLVDGEDDEVAASKASEVDNSHDVTNKLQPDSVTGDGVEAQSNAPAAAAAAATNDDLLGEDEDDAGGVDLVSDPAMIHRRNLDGAIRSLRRAYAASKRTYRIHPNRLARIQPILDQFLGTKNFHNYTIQKPFRDPSAKRHIKSFKVNETPIVINGTEWLSIKIHGQSFMMHQIRKMVAMVALTVRCGTDPARIPETFTDIDLSIPKAPALGLLLERPVFDSYNNGAAATHDRETIDFGRYEEKVEEFKRTEIYQRQFQEEAELNQFHQFFSHTDNLKDPQLLYLSSLGYEAVTKERARKAEEESRKPREEEGAKARGESAEQLPTPAERSEEASRDDTINTESKDRIAEAQE